MQRVLAAERDVGDAYAATPIRLGIVLVKCDKPWCVCMCIDVSKMFGRMLVSTKYLFAWVYKNAYGTVAGRKFATS